MAWIACLSIFASAFRAKMHNAKHNARITQKMKEFKAEVNSHRPLYEQIGLHIIRCIRSGRYANNEKLPTVNEAYTDLSVARDTMVKAYKYLQEEGWVRSVPGKGFYVTRQCEHNEKRLFVLFDAMNPYKETLYLSLVASLGEGYYCDTAFYYYDKDVFERLINNAVGKYDGYVIIAHFNTDVSPILKRIPYEQLLLLDAMPQRYDKPCSAVYQDFHNDLYEELKALYQKLSAYECMHMVFNDSFQFIPIEILTGIHQFMSETQYPIYIEKAFDVESLEKGHCYMAVSERDLACIIKVVNQRGWTLRKDIGLLSFDDTPLKEVLQGGITTISTDFRQMGELAGKLIRTGTIKRIANRWTLSDRGSL